jgi:hypothetical protein
MFKNIIVKIGFAFGLVSALAVAKVSAAYTWSVDYVAGANTVGDSQYSNFLELLNGPIGYLLGFVIGLKLLKWMWFEIKSMTPDKK